jgi:hypothetical protein
MLENGGTLNLPIEIVDYLRLRYKTDGIDPADYIRQLLYRDMMAYREEKTVVQLRSREQLGLRNDTSGVALKHYIVATEAGETQLPLELLESMREDSPSNEVLLWRINDFLSNGHNPGYLLEVAIRGGFGSPPATT